MHGPEFSAASFNASTLHLPAGPWATVLDCLCSHFSAIDRAQWLDRMARGRVLDGLGRPIDANHPYKEGLRVHYFREVAVEPSIPFEAKVLYADEHLLVADKPHFLPVTPSGPYVEQTLLRRLVHETGNPYLVPLHRIDRETAGLVLFSVQPASRAAYQGLFSGRRINKRYQAIAPALPGVEFPVLRCSRLVASQPFFRMEEGAGTPNTETRIEVLERRDELWRYQLFPVTGKKHQLRVHLAALGAGICNDPFYPLLVDKPVDDFSCPLKLLAEWLSFIDPVTGSHREFHSQLTLDWP